MAYIITNINLFFNLLFVSLSSNPIRYFGSLRVINASWRWFPTPLNGVEVVDAHEPHDAGSRLKRFLKHCRHVQVFGSVEDVR